MQSYTPMMQQYLRIKAEYADAFLFFRLGDFYEMFFEDALKASQELEITLTSRDGGAKEKIPMCGVPYHSASGYIERLIEKGYKVAICEQTEDPRQSKGVVKREVVQLITPGTVMEGKGLAEKENNYITAVTAFGQSSFSLAYTDLTTGENRAALLEGTIDLLLNELALIETKEIVIAANFNPEWRNRIKERTSAVISVEDGEELVEEFAENCASLQSGELAASACRLLHYLKKTQKRGLEHLQPFQPYTIDHYMKMDYYSKRNLELTEALRGKGRKGTLLWLLDETATAMGARKLKQWIDRPLIEKAAIDERLHFAGLLKDRFIERSELRELLKGVYDLERLAGRVAFGNANARDFMQLKRSLMKIPEIRSLLGEFADPSFDELAARLDPCEELCGLLGRAIVDEPPISVKDGGIIKDGYNADLDAYRDASRNGKTWIAELERKEKEATGIKSLKIGYNRVFGYYIEVTRANVPLLDPDRYERKQTLANAERFITPELKEKEALILEAEEKSTELEYALFLEIRETVKQYIPRLQHTAKKISELDVYQGFATVSEERHYVKPAIEAGRSVRIKEGRHPVVEKVMGSQEYVPNDCLLDEKTEMLLITGPNMSGKSTYMRQIALTAVMAQIGCFVPAASAELPIFDQIFTRIGAADDLISGQSTFMVEMLEARNAIVNATENSLILFDEIGRGTSTYDGMALAQAMIEYIHDKIRAKTLFSTHYHELTVLADELSLLENVHVSAAEQNGRLVFLHKVKPGPADKSYGIHVAELAELPEDLIARAQELLADFEKERPAETETAAVTEAAAAIEEPAGQLSFFSEAEPAKRKLPAKERKVIDEICGMNLLEMNPLQAMNALYDLQTKLKK